MIKEKIVIQENKKGILNENTEIKFNSVNWKHGLAQSGELVKKIKAY